MKEIMKTNKGEKVFWFVAALALLAAVGLVGYTSNKYPGGKEVSLEFFYFIPVALVAWAVGRSWCMVMAAICASVWFSIDIAGGIRYDHGTVYSWNIATRFGIFLTMGLLISFLREKMEREDALSHSDALTGAVNRAFLFRLIQMEVVRLARYKRPFTVVYIDLNNFRAVNERLGSEVADQVLVRVVKCVQSHIRVTDTIARVEGDEFALLLPETSLEASQVVTAKISRVLDDAMHEQSWPVSFSMGALTCSRAPKSVDDILLKADALIHEIKQDGKKGILHAEYAEG